MHDADDCGEDESGDDEVEEEFHGFGSLSDRRWSTKVNAFSADGEVLLFSQRYAVDSSTAHALASFSMKS